MIRRLVVVALLLGVSCGSATAQSPFLGPAPGPTASASSTVQAQRLPNLLYQSLDFARVAASGLGIKLKVHTKTTMEWPPNTVFAQSPQAETPVEPGQTVTVTVSVAPACDPSYPDFCIKPFLPRLRCKDLSQRDFKVLPPDRYKLDPDHNGIGCERSRTASPAPRPSPS